MLNAAVITATIEQHGQDMMLNGIPVRGIIHTADASRVQMYLAQQDWHTPCFDITLPDYVIYPPYSVASASEIYIVEVNWKMVIRKVDFPNDFNATADVLLLTVLV